MPDTLKSVQFGLNIDSNNTPNLLTKINDLIEITNNIKYIPKFKNRNILYFLKEP